MAELRRENRRLREDVEVLRRATALPGTMSDSNRADKRHLRSARGVWGYGHRPSGAAGLRSQGTQTFTCPFFMILNVLILIYYAQPAIAPMLCVTLRLE